VFSFDRIQCSVLTGIGVQFGPEYADELAGIVEQVEGVRFRELFERLPRRAKDGDEALAIVLGVVAELMRAETDEHQNTEKLFRLFRASAMPGLFAKPQSSGAVLRGES
jgi:hypothetical protein